MALGAGAGTARLSTSRHIAIPPFRAQRRLGRAGGRIGADGSDGALRVGSTCGEASTGTHRA